MAIAKRVIVLLASLLASFGLGSASALPPPIQHVFIIVLENKGYDETFGPSSPAPYLANTLTGQGKLLTQYYGTGHLSLDNYIAMVSGQGPNMVTQSDCIIYLDFVGAPLLEPLHGQAIGQGCVYPAFVPTIADQLEDANLTWKGYMQDMGNAFPAQPKNCRHAALNMLDSTQQAHVGDQYAARHNPFVYFHSIIDDQARCDAHVVPLEQNLDADLAAIATTPNYVFITPNLCEDGHDAPCVDGAPGGLVSANDFLSTWVPKILASPAYQADGLLLILFDEAEISASPSSDASACCNQPIGPNTPLAGIFGPGGGRTGAVVLSKYVTPGSTSATPYNHYSMLRSVSQLFGLTPLGYAGEPGLVAFGSDVYDNPNP